MGFSMVLLKVPFSVKCLPALIAGVVLNIRGVPDIRYLAGYPVYGRISGIICRISPGYPAGQITGYPARKTVLVIKKNVDRLFFYMKAFQH